MSLRVYESRTHDVPSEPEFARMTKVLNVKPKIANLERFSQNSVYLLKDHPLSDQAEITTESRHPIPSFDQGSNNRSSRQSSALTYEYKNH